MSRLRGPITSALALALVCAVLPAFAVYVVGDRFLIRDVQHAFLDQIRADNERVARLLEKVLFRGIAQDAADQGQVVRTVQARIENLGFPKDMFPCVVSGSGAVLCHPDRAIVEKSMSIGGFQISTPRGPRRFADVLKDGRSVSGTLRSTIRPTEVVAYVPVFGGKYFVGVHRDKATILARVERIRDRNRLLLLGVCAGVFAVLFAAVFVFALRESHARRALARFRRIADATIDFVGIAGVGGEVLYVNPAGRRMVGMGENEDLSGMSIADFHSPNVLDVLQREALPTAATNGAWSAHSAFRHRDGMEIPVSMVILAHTSASGKVEYYSTISRDVSEERRMEERLRQSRKMESLGRLAGGIAHDFNNLLTVVLGQGSLLGKSLASGDEKDIRRLAAITDAGRQAARLTRQLLAFGRKGMTVREVLNLNEIIEESMKMLRRVIGENIEVRVNPAPDLRPVMLDRGQIEQVVMNLVINARDAIDGQGTVTLATSNVDPGAARENRDTDMEPVPCVALTVTDTGQGMDEETLSRIFEPFFTTKEVGRGTGLGLATVYGIVKQNGGDIVARSRPGHGTTFEVLLPSAPETPAPSPGSAPGSNGRDAERRRGSGGNVLVVEDEELVRRMCCDALRDGGLHVFEARDTRHALALCARHEAEIDMVLTDVVMPGMSGSAFVARARRHCPNARTVYMSGYPDRAADGTFAAEPGAGFLQKPFTPDVLLATVRDMLAMPDS